MAHVTLTLIQTETFVDLRGNLNGLLCARFHAPFFPADPTNLSMSSDSKKNETSPLIGCDLTNQTLGVGKFSRAHRVVCT